MSRSKSMSISRSGSRSLEVKKGWKQEKDYIPPPVPVECAQEAKVDSIFRHKLTTNCTGLAKYM